jgi:hypothetical protein
MNVFRELQTKMVVTLSEVTVSIRIRVHIIKLAVSMDN